MNAKTLPPDWKPADFNPDFSADDGFEEQNYRLDHICCVLSVFSELSSTSGNGSDFKSHTVEFNREKLAGMFQFLHDAVGNTVERNNLMHKYICNKWGHERYLAEKALQDNS